MHTIKLATSLMEKKRCIILVPVYKQIPSSDEAASLHQLERILGGWEIRFVCPESLDMSTYDTLTNNLYAKERFADHFFEGIDGYNTLMRDNTFYRSFEEYEYMLIYQLDAWVFRDELEYWCAQGYDYIGAPWFKHYGTHEKGNKLWQCGNGGLSLRRIEKFTQCTMPNVPVYTLWGIISHANRHILRNIIRYIRYPNNMAWFIQHQANTWEDGFFCCDLAETHHALKCPKPQVAAHFAFECSPEYLFGKVTHHTLPFGCHAWRRYQFDDFWKQYIIL